MASSWESVVGDGKRSISLGNPVVDSMFNQWIDGRPWWLTLLLLPALVIAALLARVLRDVVVVGAVTIVLIVLAAWAWRRRR